MSPSLPPPPPAIHRQAPSENTTKSAENYKSSQSSQAIKKLDNRVSYEVKRKGHPVNIQPRHRHTNRLRSRKQAKQRAKRKAK